MRLLKDAQLSADTKLTMIDVGRARLGAAELEILRSVLDEARRGRFTIAHAFRTSVRPNSLGLAPARELTPRPNEPVFIREELCLFSTRAFRAWVGSKPASLVFMGEPAAAREATERAVELGHCAHLLTTTANANDAGAGGLRLLPFVPSRFAQAGGGMSSISYFAQGAPNGAG